MLGATKLSVSGGPVWWMRRCTLGPDFGSQSFNLLGSAYAHNIALAQQNAVLRVYATCMPPRPLVGTNIMILNHHPHSLLSMVVTDGMVLMGGVSSGV